MSVSTVATGMILVSLPLELRQLDASPNQIGVTLAMFGVGGFLFELVWGLLADRFGYRAPLVVGQLLYAGCLVLLGTANSVAWIAISYLLASGMMVAAGPVGRSFIGTSLPARMQGTGLAALAAQWLIGDALGAGLAGQLIERFPIRDVIYGASILPVVSAGLILLVFRGHSDRQHLIARAENDERADAPRQGASVPRVVTVTALLVVLILMGLGGESAFLPLLVTSQLHLSAADAGWALLTVNLLGGLLLIPGGGASDRWGRRVTMVAGSLISAAGFVAYARAGGFGMVLVAVAIRAVGGSLVWPAATAWISESVPRRRHALFLALFGEFENLGIAIGPFLGGLAWSLAGIQAAFLTYAAAALIAAVVAAALVHGRRVATYRRSSP
jgi:MFS family permease